ncbi:type I DNA topoisomerase [Marinilabiliaceae bacterium JC040]|nr:type I DNA topoisomerase [Marinilabiliaceae bacterium JC040]
MIENLVIVESPAKAKTIEKFLGEGFTVKSSFGHIRDLDKKDFGIDIENNFEPKYIVSTDKKNIVKELKKLAKEASTVWLASDEDREGEAIAWHLYEVLKLAKKETKRIVFHEITKEAIQHAIENPRTIDINLVNAQQARRILDRLVGFELSPVLWRKVKPSLSAGRVQSVAVRLIAERERDIHSFNPEEYYRVVANFIIENQGRNSILKAELPSRFKTEAETLSFLEACKDSTFSVKSITKKPMTKRPAAPFTTSTLQQEAGRKLGFSVAQTMSVAQHLYEAGKITYMRTDSVNLSKLAINTAKKTIIEELGEEYSKVRNYSTKSKGAQEAHEAIRPTYMDIRSAGENDQEKKLYQLIWKRTLASQMADAKLEKTTISIGISGSEKTFQASGEHITFDGFLRVYLESKDDEQEEDSGSNLPVMHEEDILDMKEIVSTQQFTNHPPRYTEASLVKKMEELGIGRPSTYAPTITTIQNRGYVLKESRDGHPREYKVMNLSEGEIKTEQKTQITGTEKKKLFPTDIGLIVTDFLNENFDNIMDYNFTASAEDMFDHIASGEKKWQETIAEFYHPFHKNVEDTIENSERKSGERLIGVDPKSGKNIIVRLGRFGPIAQIGTQDDEEKPVFAGLKKEQSIETITLEECLELFKFPRQLGTYEEKTVTIGIGRFGPYVRHNNKFVSIKKDLDDPSSIDLERAIELIEAKREADRNKIIKIFENDEEMQILNGRWGPYVAYEKKNVRIPKDVDASSLTYEECLEMVKNAPEKKTGGRKTTTKKKTTSKKTSTSKKKTTTTKKKATTGTKKKTTSKKTTGTKTSSKAKKED